MVLIVVLAGGLVYFWRKYRTVQKRLEYEMSDARNMAQISTAIDVPEAKAETYQHIRSQQD